jgi:hypothetical protein
MRKGRVEDVRREEVEIRQPHHPTQRDYTRLDDI